MRAIVTYHSIDDSGSPVSTSPSTFRRHVGWLASGAVRVVSLSELLALPDGVAAVAITFDDGFRNFAELAAPLLIERGIPATVFVVSGAVGKTNRWTDHMDAGVPELPLATWQQLARVLEQGITLGAHTRTHARLPALSADRLEDEIHGSRESLAARLGVLPLSFAYPYGEVDARASAIVSRSYDVACTTELRPLQRGDDRHLLPRLDSYYLRAPGALEAWGTQRQRWRLAARAVGRRVRRSLSMRSR